MRSGNIIVIIFSLFTLISCGTDEISSYKMSIKQVIHPISYKDQFEYNNERLISFKRYCYDILATDTEFQYENDKLSKIITKDNSGLNYLIELEFGENGLRKSEKSIIIYNGDTASVNVIHFSYDSNNILKSKRHNQIYPENIISETEFEWINGNIVKANYFNIDDLGKQYSWSRSYTYDNRKNYTNQELAFNYTIGSGLETLLSRNNVVSTSDQFSGQLINRGSNSYKYNNQGYPIISTYIIGDPPYDTQMIYE